MNKLQNGDRILITWFPDNRSERNAYIGMEGIVTNLKNDGCFELNCGNCWLIVGDNKYRYLKIYENNTGNI